MATVDLFAIGNALIDQEFKVSDDFLSQQGLQKGTMQLSDGETQSPLYEKLKQTQDYKGQASGGSAANTTVAFSALGGSAFYGCRVGHDELGGIYLQGLNDAGIQTTPKSISEGVTGTCMVLISPDSERTMHTYLGITAELSQDQIDFEPLKTAKWLYIEGYLSTSETARKAVKQAREIAKAHGVKIALSLSDPAMVQYAREGLEELMDDGVDLLFCNEQEALMYTHTTTVEDALTQLRFKNHTVVITQSAKGALVANPTHHFHVAGRHVEAVDTNGAGDAFAGAFLYALNHHEDLTAAAQLAILISSEVVSQFGPRLAINDYAKLLENFQKECA
ncbi:adenosine kinase [Acinetobacter baumannii]